MEEKYYIDREEVINLIKFYQDNPQQFDFEMLLADVQTMSGIVGKKTKTGNEFFFRFGTN